MSIRSTLIAAGTLALLSCAVAVADNTVNIGGSGGGKVNINASAAGDSVIDIYQVAAVPGVQNQVGTDASPVTQSGTHHTARIGQGATYDGGAWTGGAAVAGNTASISQVGATLDQAAIYQATSDNTAAISQSAAGQTATITQGGSTGNQAVLGQSGAAALAASITQNGAAASTLVAIQAATEAYTLTVTQGGSGGHYASVETTSGFSGGGAVGVNQTGASNTAYVTGMSGGSATINQSGTNGYAKLENQSAGALTVTQNGANNWITVSNYGLGQSLAITQSGDRLDAGNPQTTGYDPDPAPSGPTFAVSPP